MPVLDWVDCYSKYDTDINSFSSFDLYFYFLLHFNICCCFLMNCMNIIWDGPCHAARSRITHRTVQTIASQSEFSCRNLAKDCNHNVAQGKLQGGSPPSTTKKDQVMTVQTVVHACRKGADPHLRFSEELITVWTIPHILLLITDIELNHLFGKWNCSSESLQNASKSLRTDNFLSKSESEHSGRRNTAEIRLGG